MRFVVPSLVFGVLLLIISLGRFIFWQLWLIPLPQFILDIFSGSAFPLVEVSGFAGAALLLESWQRGSKRAASGGAPQEQVDHADQV